MDSGELTLLETDLFAQTREIERIYTRIDERARSEAAYTAESLAYQLHNLYSAFEQLFEIIAETFENHLTGESGYHVGPLGRMNVGVEGVRPPLVPDELLTPLDSLRSFRHFFRHAYAQEIDRRRVEPVLADAELVRGRYQAMIRKFLEALRT